MTAHGLYYNSEATRTKRTGQEVTRGSAGEAGSREQAFDSIGVGKLNITPSGSTPAAGFRYSGNANILGHFQK